MAANYFWSRRQPPVALTDTRVWITGASSGIGEALAHQFHQQGALCILSARREVELQRVRDECVVEGVSGGVAPLVLPLDLSDVEGLAGKADEALRMAGGRLDYVVLNGGVSTRSFVAGSSLKVHAEVLNINYLSSVAISLSLLPGWIRQGSGALVVIGSVQGKLGLPGRAAYSASKHALQGFCDSLRAEVADAGVGVLLVNPGYVNTQLSVNALTGSGQLYSKMDPATANGISPKKAATQIMQAIQSRKSEIFINAPLSVRLAILLRALLPSVVFAIMRGRARKLLRSLKSD